MSEIRFDEWDDEYDDGDVQCFACWGAGFVHGCCDDYCRSGEAIWCTNSRTCIACHGEGRITFVPASTASTPPSSPQIGE